MDTFELFENGKLFLPEKGTDFSEIKMTDRRTRDAFSIVAVCLFFIPIY